MSPTPRTVARREEGHAMAGALDVHTSALVVGRDPSSAAEVALGIAEVQARRRRVALGDLAGDLPVFQDRVPDDAPHGLLDAFVHGVSLNRIAHAVDRAGNLFLLPTGAGPVDYESILPDDRWRRLANGFRETGALLLVVAPADAPGIEALARALGGVVRIDGAEVPAGVPVVAESSRAARPAVPDEPVPAVAGAPAAVAGSADGDAVDVLRRRTSEHAARDTRRASGWWIVAAAGLVLGVGAVLGWMNRERLGLVRPRAATGAPAPAPAAATPAADTGRGPVANPADSANAAAYIVVIANVTDTTAAAQRLAASLRGQAAATWSPDAPWVRVSVGAFATEAAADTALRRLRRDGVLEPESGYLLRAPLSLRLTTIADSAAAQDSLASWRARGLPAFALRQDDGSITLYAGAFESAEQAAAGQAALGAAAPTAAIAYRVGRAF